MENRKSELYGLIFVCMLGVMALAGIGFALLSNNLTIGDNSGDTATLTGGTWDIHFGNLSSATITGDAAVTTAPTITNSTTIPDFAVTLKKPGDTVVYTFDIINGGTLDAILSSYTAPSFTLSGSGTNAATDVANMTGHVIYTLKYTSGIAPAVNDRMNKSTSKNVTLTVGFDSAATTVPTGDVTVNLGEIQFVYSQAATQST